MLTLYNYGADWTDFDLYLYLEIFRKFDLHGGEHFLDWGDGLQNIFLKHAEG